MSVTNPMTKFAMKYLVIVGSLVFLFTNFIACGSQSYQVSLRDDFDDSQRKQFSKKAVNAIPGIHAVKGWAELPIMFKLGEKVEPEQKTGLLNAMQKWHWATGKQLFSQTGIHKDTKGDSFYGLYDSLDDSINGHYLDFDWEKTEKPSVVLATTIWNNTADPEEIDTADIRFNSNHYLIGNSLHLTPVDSREVVDMESLSLHELGHLLGLSHMESANDPHSVMNPSLYIGEGLVSRSLSRGDIIRIQQIYGCAGDACDIDNLFAGQNKSGSTQTAH